jgi:hypothetical protein
MQRSGDTIEYGLDANVNLSVPFIDIKRFKGGNRDDARIVDQYVLPNYFLGGAILDVHYPS